MGTNQKAAGGRFWAWISFAFLLGAVVGFAACIVTMIVLQAMISYAP
ncbi:MAG TPA: hypothetical protein VGH33_12615 [Isosphaeraceae bacterium]|jgi:hypothetical protein